jgi:hypothetical protein
MSYSTSNPPQLQAQAIAGGKTWYYTSTDSVATVVGSTYFSNGDALGMDVGDFVHIFDSNTGDGGVAVVTAVVAGGAATADEYQAVTT